MMPTGCWLAAWLAAVLTGVLFASGLVLVLSLGSVDSLTDTVVGLALVTGSGVSCGWLVAVVGFVVVVGVVVAGVGAVVLGVGAGAGVVVAIVVSTGWPYIATTNVVSEPNKVPLTMA